MPDAKRAFEEYYAQLLQAVHDPMLSAQFPWCSDTYSEAAARAKEKSPHMVELARAVRKVKEESVARLDDLVQTASESLRHNGAQVYYARKAEDSLRIIDQIVGRGKVIVSGKTMTGEEIGLRHHHESLGNEFWETDVGAFLQQIRQERPMHPVIPAAHVTREESARQLSRFLGKEIPTEPSAQVRAIREFLRQKFFQADVGVTGCNVLAAREGTIFLLENEGNIRMASTAPPVHIALVGIEKVVPNIYDALQVANLTWTYAGFSWLTYLSMIGGPSNTADIELTRVFGATGPKELHVIFLDNGRSAIARDHALKEALYCLRCGGCHFECPVYRLTAGHYGYNYQGGIGAVGTAYISGGFERAAPIAYTCLRCGRCKQVCPLSIDVPAMNLELRRRMINMARS
jgi:iron-sulfur cluster protein